MGIGEPSEFRFHYLPSKRFDSIDNADARACLLKWSMKDRIKIQAYCFDQTFNVHQKENFVLAFLRDPLVSQNLQVLCSNGKWSTLGKQVEHFSIEDISCSLTSMTFFDRLHNDQIVKSESGYIVKCFEEFCEEIPELSIDNELKKMLLLENSLNFNMFSKLERNEFLFLIFRHFCLGGSLCQYEDVVEPYLFMSKSLYKDLIGVHNDKKSGQIVVATFVYKVMIKDDIGPIYPSQDNHPQDFAYICINPMKKQTYLLYHKFGVSLPEIK